MQYKTIIVMGVSGVGKTSVARGLAAKLDGVYLEADDLHPPANVAAMSQGKPLTDEMRAPWLKAVATAIAAQKATTPEQPVVTACSALKRDYRDVIRGALPDAVFVHLMGDKDLIAQRMVARTDHFMPVTLLESQLLILEPLAQDEAHVCVDVAGSHAEVLDAAVTSLTS